MASQLSVPERARRFVQSKTKSTAGVEQGGVEAAAPARSIFARVPASVWPVLAVVIFLALWRTAFVLAGPDPDSDAYGHHAIARQILVDPKNLTVHWVWLPLFHYAQALAILVFGATMDTVRLANVCISAAVPIFLYLALRDTRRDRRDPKDAASAANDPVPALAAIVCALNPIAMQMGTTGQTEPSFALLAMLSAWALVRDRFRALAIVLTLAVLLRYEAWSILCGVIALFVVERVFPKIKGDRRSIPWWVVASPVLAVLGWAALRRPVDGSWFWFLRGTREFANGALGAKSSFQLGGAQLAKDLTRYAIEIPWRVVGWPLLLVPFGLVRTVRREGLRFVTPFVSVLGFVTLAWVMRSSLGLDRHFVALVPFYATMIANGMVVIGAFLASIVGRVTRSSEHAFLAEGATRFAVVVGFSCATFLLSAGLLDDWMSNWTHWRDEVWPDRREIAAVLRTLPANVPIFTDEPTVEVFSGLDRHRFERIGVADPARVKARVDRDGEVWVVSWARSLKDVAPLGEVVWRPRDAKPDEGLMAVRVRPR
jgi:4-amino-4-deoxy-L-arabinose transferase-like glycosyltransferase